MKLSLFNGGLDVRRNPKLIQPNEAVEIENVDTSTGMLKAAKSKTATTVNITNKPFYYKGNSEWMDVAGALDYLEYKEKLYYTTATTAKKYDGTTTDNLGINAPTAAPTVSVDTQNYVLATAEAKEFNLTFELEKATSGTSYAAIKYYTLVLTVGGVVIYKQTKTTQLNPADLKVVVDDSITATIYTPADYSATTNNVNGVTVTVGAAPALASNLLGDQDNVPAQVLKVGAPQSEIKVQSDNKFIFAVGTRSQVSGVRSRPVECEVQKKNQSYVKLTGTTNSFGPVSYPVMLVFYIKINGIYYAINEQATSSTGFTQSTLTYNYLQNLDISSATKWTPSNLLGIYQYVYTHYNNNDGTESAPSPLSAEVDCYGMSVYLSGMTAYAGTDSQVTHKRIYRVGGNLSNFILVATVADATTTYSDTTTDLNLTGAILDSQYNEPPPSGLRYLTKAYGCFFGAVGDKLHFTRDIGNPNYWPSTYYIDFPEDITGIGNVGNNLIVFTQYKAWLMYGSSAATFVPIELRGDQGCINHATIADMDGQLLWVSTDGICITTGNNIKVLSKDKLGKQSLNTVNADVIDEAYYLQLTDGRLLVFDIRYEPNFKYFDCETDYVLNVNDELYGRVDGGTLLSTLFDNTSLLSYTYKTGELTEGSVSNHKTYNIVYVHSDGTATFKIYIDGTLVQTKAIVAGLNEVKVPAGKQRGYFIQFVLTGTGTINEIEYLPSPRSTGD